MIMPASMNKALFAVFGAASLFAVGCVGKTTDAQDGDAQSTSAALELENGGLGGADEQPAFGDNKFAQIPDLAARVDLDPPDVTNAGNEIMSAAGVRVYTIALV
jgi:hypothetical protein